MKLLTAKLLVSTALLIPFIGSQSRGAIIAGCDFSDAATFNAAGGAYNTNMDDPESGDGITVSNWSFANSGSFVGFDSNAQTGMPNDNVAKFNGDGQGLPTLGSSGALLATHSFTITIPSTHTVDLSSITFEWRKATPSGDTRWLAFDTCEDSGIIFSELGLARNAYDSQVIDLSGASYQGLTDQTVTFNFYAGGGGSGDIDIDTIVLNGSVSPIPEPSSLMLCGFGALGLILCRRR